MAKRSTNKKYRNTAELDELTDSDVVVAVKAKTVATKNIQSQISVKYVTHGTVTGNKYVWAKAGDIQSVASEDAPALLAKRLKNGCCGPTAEKVIFVEVD